jgi:L-2-hydroxyglutarate oxidase LhgO
MDSLLRDAREEGIEVRLGVPWTRGVEGGFLVNAAGLGAVTIAQSLGLGRRYRMIPFQGLYLRSSEPAGSLRTHIYPVPDARFPFLGVHFTLTVDGHVKIGPTARPPVIDGLRLLLTDRALGAYAFGELRKRSRAHMVRLAASLATGVRREDYRQWGTPGVRAQLYDRVTRRLVMDFVVERDARSLHILNAVSPGFTCAMSFAEYVVEMI